MTEKRDFEYSGGYNLWIFTLETVNMMTVLCNQILWITFWQLNMLNIILFFSSSRYFMYAYTVHLHTEHNTIYTHFFL